MAKKKKVERKLDENVIITGFALEIPEEAFNDLLKSMAKEGKQNCEKTTKKS